MTTPEFKESKNLSGLKDKLREMFQLDQAELDFGIYRVMNAKRDEVERFLEHDLLPQVQKSLAEYQPAGLADLRRELAEIEKNPGKYAPDYAEELRKKLEQGFDVSKIEEEVYSHLLTFFSRYYHSGDFMSLRRYKEGVYALPYSGEEVKLHWANADQYYIKSSESFHNYVFKTPQGRVRFELVAASTERDNNKAANEKNRRFILHSEEPLGMGNGDLLIRFVYRPDDELKADGKPHNRKQDALNALAVEGLLGLPADVPVVAGIADWSAWREALGTKAPTEKNPDRTVLAKRLTDYTAKNTFDYFIHKDLGGFLRRELDFFIKNEVMHLDDIENESAPKAEQYLSKIKVMRGIAHKIIDFLGSLENFQKKLWLKKKFVLETNWLVTLDKVPEDLFAGIAANDAQRAEWVKLFAIDEITTDLGGAVAYSEPLTEDFLKANPFLVVDTAFFDHGFKDKLLASLDDIDEETNGLLVHGDNFHALNLLQERYRRQVECIYIDPPYNTDATPIHYKNGYKSSSWMSLLYDRLKCSSGLLRNDGVLVAAIDDEQQRELSFLLSGVFNNNIGTICVRSNPSERPTKSGYSVSHEYLLFSGQSSQSGIGRLPPTEEQRARFSQRDEQGPFEWRNLRREGSNSDRDARRALYYPIFITENSMRVPVMAWDDTAEEWILEESPMSGEQIVFPDNDEGREKTWRWEPTTVMGSLSGLAVRKDRTGRDYVYYKRRPHEEGVVSVSSWFDAKYSATEHGSALLKKLFGEVVFSYPKSIFAVTDAIYVGGVSKPESCVVDFFAGSGTTGHAVINLNRSDNGRRKFVLVEMGLFFDEVLKARIEKVVYSHDWKDGKPVSREGFNHLTKYIRLESYEDATDNLVLTRAKEQQRLVERHDQFREDYTIRYMLDVEARDSLLDIDAFADPFAYKMTVVRDGERKQVNVDLIETFNYLLGLRVQTREPIRGVYVVTGLNPHGEKVLVLWRNVAETDNDQLDDWFKKQDYNSRDMEFDLIYVNGDNNVENLKRSDETWKVRLIEQDFHTLMFDVEDV